MQTLESQNKYTIEQFAQALQSGVNAIVEAAKILVNLVDEDVKVYDRIVSKYPNISYNMLANIERVGRGVLHAPLLYDTSPGARKLVLLPFSQQKALYDSPIEIAHLEGEKLIVERKRIQELTQREANTVFQNNRILTPEQQEKLLRTPKAPPAPRYRIEEDGSVTFLMSPINFTASQLEEILNKAKEQSKKTLASAMKRKQVDKKK